MIGRQDMGCGHGGAARSEGGGAAGGEGGGATHELGELAPPVGGFSFSSSQ